MCIKSSYILIQNTFERINYWKNPNFIQILVSYCLNVYPIDDVSCPTQPGDGVKSYFL